MYYCNDCADENHWPESMVKYVGRCEICRKTRECNDKSSDQLPKAYTGYIDLMTGEATEPKLHDEFEHHNPKVKKVEDPWIIRHDTKGVSFEEMLKPKDKK